MRAFLISLTALGALGAAAAAQAQLSVTVGPEPYWRTHSDSEWRARHEYREAEFRRHEWVREHCVRDWGGHEFCRR
jgi:hypothetical protein